MALEKFKVLEIIHQNSIKSSLIKVYRISEEEMGDFVFNLNHLSTPEYIRTEIGSEMNYYCHNKARAEQTMLIDLSDENTFTCFEELVNDKFGVRATKVYSYNSTADLYNMERFLNESEDEDEYDVEGDYCPNCEDVILDVGETCQFCGQIKT